MLYNCEVWVINKSEMKALERRNVYMMRKVVGMKAGDEDERWSNEKLMAVLGLESVERMIQQRRLQWVAHSARRGEGDLTWRIMHREIEDKESQWGRQIREDWYQLGIDGVGAWCAAVADRAWLRQKLQSSRA